MKKEDKPVIPYGRTLQVTFCDDIRREASNKLMFIGTYGNVMYSKEFPLTVKQMYVFANVHTPARQPFKELTVRVSAGDHEVKMADISEEEMASQTLPENYADDEFGGFSLNFGFLLEDLTFYEPSSITVEMETESEIIRSLPLLIRNVLIP